MHAGRRRHGFWLLLPIAVLAAASVPPAALAADVTVTYDVPCMPQSFLVPAGVTSVTIDAFGASGGKGTAGGPGGPEGLGGRVKATLAVTPLETLAVNVGGFGGDGGAGVGGAGGCNGGKQGGNGAPNSGRDGAGGGGASDVRQGGTVLALRVLIAGGGGGAGGATLGGSGGTGGGTVGGPGNPGGGAGGGAGGVGGAVTNAGNDASTGQSTSTGSAGGGGGGGGQGGMGGLAGTLRGGGGGGGGGSGFVVASATNVTQTSGVHLGNGVITITYTEPPTAVTVASMRASLSPRGVLVRWRTTSEVGIVGFNLYRERRGRLVKLNGSVLATAPSGTRGRTYSWLDRVATRRPGTLRYRLQVVRADGTRAWAGRVTAARGAGKGP